MFLLQEQDQDQDQEEYTGDVDAGSDPAFLGIH
jgi:hypothetical protein